MIYLGAIPAQENVKVKVIFICRIVTCCWINIPPISLRNGSDVAPKYICTPLSRQFGYMQSVRCHQIWFQMLFRPAEDIKHCYQIGLKADGKHKKMMSQSYKP